MSPSPPAPDSKDWAKLREARRDFIAAKKAARAKYLELRKPAWEAFRAAQAEARAVQAQMVVDATAAYNTALQALMVVKA